MQCNKMERVPVHRSENRLGGKKCTIEDRREKKKGLPDFAALRSVQQPLSTVDGKRRIHRCYYCQPIKIQEGNLVNGLPDEKVRDKICPIIFKSQTDPMERLQLMLKLRLLNKTWRLVVNDTDDWFDHVCFRPGFSVEKLWSEYEQHPLYAESNPPRRCMEYPILTIDDILIDSEFSTSSSSMPVYPAKKSKAE
jgi:hypothetical protein